MTTLTEIINPKQEPPIEHRIPHTALIRLKQLAMFKIRKNFYDERFLSIIDNKRYVALRDAKLISDEFFYELYLDCTAGEKTGFMEWEQNQLRIENARPAECRSDGYN